MLGSLANGCARSATQLYDRFSHVQHSWRSLSVVFHQEFNLMKACYLVVERRSRSCMLFDMNIYEGLQWVISLLKVVVKEQWKCPPTTC